MLEKLVQARTSELRSTMQQLNEETRHAAILAEDPGRFDPPPF